MSAESRVGSEKRFLLKRVSSVGFAVRFFFPIFLFIFGCAGILLLPVGFFLVMVSRGWVGYSPVAVHGLLIAVTSLAAKPRL